MKREGTKLEVSSEVCLGAGFAISNYFFIKLQYKDLFVNYIFQKK